MADRRVRVVLEAQIAQFQAGMRQAQAELGQVAQAGSRGEKQMGGMGAAITGRVIPAVAGMVGGFQIFDKVIKGGFERFADLEDAEKRLRQMGLSTGEINTLMAGLTDTVTGTAFALNDGASIMAQFVSSGMDLDEVNDRLEMTADTAAFAQAPLNEIGDIFVRIQSEGRLTGETLNMLQVRGVPALTLLADAAGTSESAMREMISKGMVDADSFFGLWETGSQGFGANSIKIAGSAQSMGDTIRGALANAGTALKRLGEELLDDFMPALRAVADGFRESADAVGAFMEETQPVRDFFGDTIGQLIEWDRQILEFMGIMEEEGPAKTFQSSMDGAKSAVGGMAGATTELAEGMSEVAEETNAAADALDAYQDALKAATDPVFALHSAVLDLDEAQRGSSDAVRDLKRAQEDLNELRGDSEASSRDLEDAERAVADAQREVEDSGWAVAEALAEVEAAALNGDLSFSDFSSKLDQWVASGEITAGQADTIRERVADLIGIAEDYTGEYPADFLAETNEGKLKEAKDALDAAARARHPKYLAELDRRQEIQVRNRMDALADTRRGIFKPQMDEAARARTKARLDAVAIRRRPEFRAEVNSASASRVRAILGQLARPRHMVISVGYAVTGSGLPAGVSRGHQGGMLTGSGVRRFHTGGMLPRFHGGGGLFGSMSGNEVPFIGLRGERVLSIPQTEALHRVLRMFGTSTPAPRSQAGGAGPVQIQLTVTGRGSVGQAEADRINYLLSRGHINIKPEAIRR